MRAVVLGATGFIGGQIARAACDAGYEVHALRRRPNATGAVGDLPIAWCAGDLDDSDSLIRAMQGCDVLFHAAGYAPDTERSVPRALRTGVAQMRRVLDAAAATGVERVIYTSSLSTIGPPPPGADRLADERDGYLPGSTGNAYYEVKWAMEHEALRAAIAGLPVVSLCPTAVFGPGDVKPSTGRILLEVARGRIPVGIEQVANVVDGRDVGLAHIRAVEHSIPGERTIIGGHNVAITEALRLAAEIAEVRPPRRSLSLRTTAVLLRAADVLRLPIPATMRALPQWQALNAEKGWHTLGFQPRPLEDTIRDTIDWFRANAYL